MKWLERSERPSDRSASRWLLDAVIAILAGLAAVPYLYRDNAHPSAAAIPVLLFAVAPLVVRRIFPLPVLGWLVLASITTAAWNDHVIPGLAVLIALFTVATMRPRREAVISAGALELVVIVAAIDVSGGAFWYGTIFLSGLIAAALGLGLYIATRRAYLEELRDRAERLERERDQQGALAAAGERARIAREMHDIVAHHLTVMVALSDGAIAASVASPERGIEVMRTVSATGRQALTDTRRLLGVLRQSPDDDPDGVLHPVPDLAELDTLLERIRAAGLPTTLEIRGIAAQVPAGVQLTVYRLVQEALTNTLKHGGADAHASVRLSYLPDELHVDVIDDGAGASAPAPVGAGGGLSGMRERVKAYGGDISAGPGRSSGWRVTARLALNEAGPQ